MEEAGHGKTETSLGSGHRADVRLTLRHTSDVLPRATAPMKDTDAGGPDRYLSPDPKAPASVPPNRESSWDNLKS